MTEFRGARGSNTGDDFHELWATRHAIRLLWNDDGLEAVTVEGLASSDESGATEDTWDGVDCALYFGGSNAATADQIVLEQLKYSAATPKAQWTVARLVGGPRRERSVIARLVKAWKGLKELRPGGSVPGAVLVTNQAIAQEVISAFAHAAAAPLVTPRSRPKATARAETRLAYAAGLTATEFREFSAAIRFEGGAGSRFVLEEQVLQAIADWTDQDVQPVVTGLRQFIRQRMRPEFAGEAITRESIMLHLGASEAGALFPCPSEITLTETPVSRAPVGDAIGRLLSGVQYLCLHGRAGVGKTTALQEIEAALPAGSLLVKYDCYGAGRYMDPSALRHRATDAFLQLTNELAARLKLPLLLSRHQGSNYPRLFANRLKHAAVAVSAQEPGALIVIAIDAADNAVTAAQRRVPAEACFVHEFAHLTGQPENVRFVVTARTGRLHELGLPSSYQTIPLEPFSRLETGEYVRRVWSAPEPWIDDFHYLSGGVPRVQAYAFKVDGKDPSAALDRLRPDGKSLDEVFRQQFGAAIMKSGNPTEVAKLCAGLIALPRPVPLSDLAAVLGSTEAQLADVCADLAPGIRVHNNEAGFADEDFEDFVRSEGLGYLAEVQDSAASWLLSQAAGDRYAALNVAAALASAGRGAELLELVEREPAPAAVADPVLRREAELHRLRLAIKVCREAGDVPHALRFVLIGAEGIKTEAALRELLVEHPDMTAHFAQETAGRLILSDPDRIQDHGPLLFQKLAVDADLGDAISVREGRRLLRAWMQARDHHYRGKEDEWHRRAWKISTSDISSAVEATLKLDGPEAALRELGSWRPWHIALEVAAALPFRLIAEGGFGAIEPIVASELLGPRGRLFLLIPLALAGRPVEVEGMARGLEELARRRLKLKRFFDTYHDGPSPHGLVLEVVLTACEILASKNAAPELLDQVLDGYLAPELRLIDRRHPHEASKLDLLFRAYALREARAGRKPAQKEIFAPRREPTDETKKRQEARIAEEHDRPLMELTNALFGIYAAVADALVNRRTDAELHEGLGRAVGTLEREDWRISRQHGSATLRQHAAKSLLVLLAAGYDPLPLKKFAAKVHGNWRAGYNVPNDQVVGRMSLWGELHASVLEDLATAAGETRKMRIGADEKSKTLVSYARLVKPISSPDANAIFNEAVEAASELDREVMAQIRFLDKLVARGAGAFPDPRRTARQVSDIAADAAIRLEGHDHFPWGETMSALVTLDTPLALANVARWDDEAVATLGESLPPLLKTALRHASLKPAQAAALSLLLDNDHGIAAEVLEHASAAELSTLPRIAEEIAYDVVARHGLRRNDAVTLLLEKQGALGPWSQALRRQDAFLSALPSELLPKGRHDDQPSTEADGSPPRHTWNRDTLLESEQFRSAVEALQEEGRARHSYVPISSILQSARSAVLPRDRVAHLVALSELDDLTIGNDAVRALLESIDAWWDSPAVRTWCRTRLPEVIVRRLPEFSGYLRYGTDDLAPALKRTGLTDLEIQDLVLRGIEHHVDGFGSEFIFELAGFVGANLAPLEAAGVTDWYSGRLASRIPAEHRDQTSPDSALPCDVAEAVARFVFAYMGDYDLRMRWRAAHALRRLARVEETPTLAALVAQYGRREEIAFRGRQLAFYWLAARLWFVLAWDRVAGERPDIAEQAASTLLQIALDDTFPHLLVRSFAREASEKLISAGCVVLCPKEKSALESVNETSLPRAPAAKSTRRHFPERDQGRRFRFDWMDTIRYWYEPWMGAFADVDGERFLREVEHWILDIWGYRGDVRDTEKERRRGRFRDRDWLLSSNSHGSTPTLERLDTHLEWHAMWCAAGELMKTEPLASPTESWESWDDLYAQVRREKLSEPPLWSADLLTPTPLVPQNWGGKSSPLDEWTLAVCEADHRAELFPSDQPEYVVVDGDSERRAGDRIETISISSALVDPGTGGSLLRALQTMDDAWDYKLPEEGEDHEIQHGPYRLLGWLRNPSRDTRMDGKDPLRGYATIITARPGRRVADACGLARDKDWRARWSRDAAQPPMFVFETWGEEVKDEERYMEGIAVAGRRLLAHKEQLRDFLQAQQLDLIVEVEVRRRGRESGRYSGEEEKEKSEGRFDRLYRLSREGALEVAEGRIGPWTGNRPAT